MPLHYEKTTAKIGFGKDKETKYVGKRRLADPFDIKRLAKEVSHITGQHEAQVLITLQFMTQAVEDAIKDGRSIDLGFGTLSPAISTKAADTAEEVKVVRKRVLFRASKELRTIVQNMSVKLITDEDDDDTDTAPDDDEQNATPHSQGENQGGGGSGSGSSGTGGDTPSGGNGTGSGPGGSGEMN